MGELLNKKRENDNWFNAFLVIILAVLTLMLLFKLTYSKIYVVGSSMENTLTGAPNNDETQPGGDYVYIFKAKPHRGDIAVINTPDKYLIKRIIAVGGDRVAQINGVLYLNGQKMYEPYVSPEKNMSPENNFEEITVKDGYIFFLGDNRDNSRDSRSECYGCLPQSNVIGIVADWSLRYKDIIKSVNTFFDFTLPAVFSGN